MSWTSKRPIFATVGLVGVIAYIIANPMLVAAMTDYQALTAPVIGTRTVQCSK